MNTTSTSHTKTARAAKFGKRADFTHILNVVDESHHVTRLPEMLQITKAGSRDDEPSVCFLFRNGTAVSWNNDDAFTLIEENATTIFTDLNETPVTEEIQYTFTDGDFEIEEDVFIIPHNDIKSLLSVSYAIAKSLQIEDSEQKVAEVSKRVNTLPTELAARGRTGMNGKQIKKLIGAIMELQFTVSTAGLAEDRPDVFWDNPRLAQFYTKTAVYLELDDRWNVLSEKLSALHSTIEILRDEVNTRQSHALEWVIIILIVIEIVWALFDRIVK